MSELARLQALFQAALLAGDETILASLRDSSRTTRDVLFGVYRNAYVGRLVEVLGNEYGVLRAYMGEAAFDAMARAYIAAHPSRRQNARWVGAHLVGFLRRHEGYAPRGELADLAAIEMALSDAFDAEDADPLSEGVLAGVVPDQWGRLAFAPHPSTRSFEVGSNAFAIWRAVREEGAPPPAGEAGADRYLFVWRDGTMPKIRVLDAEAWMAWQEMANGRTFGELCALLAFAGEADSAPVRAVQHLKSWLASGALAGVRVTEAA